MSRTNPNKRKRRETKRTFLLYCEGSDEKAFLGYLKMLFAKNGGVFVVIKENHGGEADGVLRGVLRQNMADTNVCIYDIDTGVDVELKKEREEQGVLCIENKPCLEAFLLEILEGKNYSHHQKCDDCKQRFESKYLDSKKRKDKRNYAKNFPEKLLIQRAKTVENLKILIDLISGKK